MLSIMKLTECSYQHYENQRSIGLQAPQAQNPDRKNSGGGKKSSCYQDATLRRVGWVDVCKVMVLFRHVVHEMVVPSAFVSFSIPGQLRPPMCTC